MAAPSGATPKACFMSGTIPDRPIARDGQTVATWAAMYPSRRLRWPTMSIPAAERQVLGFPAQGVRSWPTSRYDYIIIGAGLTGASASRGHQRARCAGHDPARRRRAPAPLQPAAAVETVVDRQGDAGDDLRAQGRVLRAAARHALVEHRDHIPGCRRKSGRGSQRATLSVRQAAARHQRPPAYLVDPGRGPRRHFLLSHLRELCPVAKALPTKASRRS